MLKMTDEQRYSAVLRELGEVLQEKNTTICCLRWQIDELEAKLEHVKRERDEATKHAAALDEKLLAAECEIDELKGGVF